MHAPTPRPLAWATALALILPAAAAADDEAGGGTPTKVLVPAAKKLARMVLPPVGELIELTEDNRPTPPDFGDAEFSGLSVVVSFRQPVTKEAVTTSSVLGLEVPGRGVTVRIKAMVTVDYAFDLTKVKVEPDPDYEDSLTITLPEIEVRTRYDAEEEAEYEVVYGALRSRLLNGEMAAEQRRAMYAEVKKGAIALAGAEALAEAKRRLAEELQPLLRERHPGVRIYVK